MHALDAVRISVTWMIDRFHLWMRANLRFPSTPAHRTLPLRRRGTILLSLQRPGVAQYERHLTLPARRMGCGLTSAHPQMDLEHAESTQPAMRQRPYPSPALVTHPPITAEPDAERCAPDRPCHCSRAIATPRSLTSRSDASTAYLRGAARSKKLNALRAGHGRLDPGAIISRYKVLGFLGEGSMGQVYHVRDIELEREVALKCIKYEGFGVEQAEMLLRREAQAMAQVEHPAVIRIYDVGASVGRLFVTMELARGGTLSAWARVRSRGWPEVVRAFVEAGHGLAAAHRVGLVHCDIKPQNILFDSHGYAKIGDFGLARTLYAQSRELHVHSSSATTSEASSTWARVIEGTIPYMAPEQLSGGLVDARADQFAFCVALWELLCGQRPFRVPNAALSPALFLKAITTNAIDDPAPRERILRRVLMVVRRGLAAERAERWRSMDDLLDALERAAYPSCTSRLATWR